MTQENRPHDPPLRRGWTTGACAAAAAKAATAALVSGAFPDPVEIALPSGRRVAFALARHDLAGDSATAAIVGCRDDPDVASAVDHRHVRRGNPGSGVTYTRGGVGLVTRPACVPAASLPSTRSAKDDRGVVRGPAMPTTSRSDFRAGREMASARSTRASAYSAASPSSARRHRHPYSCSSWIHSIHRGIDVARAMGFAHVSGATGNASEIAAQKLHSLHEVQLIDMGDFAGGMLKYLRDHPVARVTVAGGVAKMTKLAQGMLDLHSSRGAADLDALAAVAEKSGASAGLVARIRAANTVAEAFSAAAESIRSATLSRPPPGPPPPPCQSTASARADSQRDGELMGKGFPRREPSREGSRCPHPYPLP